MVKRIRPYRFQTDGYGFYFSKVEGLLFTAAGEKGIDDQEEKDGGNDTVHAADRDRTSKWCSAKKRSNRLNVE